MLIQFKILNVPEFNAGKIKPLQVLDFVPQSLKVLKIDLALE